MEATYRRELEHNYLVLEQKEYEENYQVPMLLKNRIPGFLECRMTRLDRDAAFYYEITSRQNLALILERKRIGLKELVKLLEGIERAVRACEEYLLDPEWILLKPEYLYLDPDTFTAAICFFPFEQQDTGEELLALAEYLLDRLDRQDAGAVTLGYEFYRMAGEENPSLGKLLESWRDAEPEKKAEEKPKSRYPSEEEPENLPEACVREKGPEENFQSVFPEWSENPEGGTACLAGIREPGLFLRSESPSYPDLRINKESFLVGKKKDAVDGWLKARGISRIHGKISREEDCYYLTDLNSTNGTFLNGGRLGVNEKARLRPGDCVGFADVRYVVEG